MFIYLAFTGGVNWNTAWLIFLAIYFFCFQLSFIVIYYDYLHTRMRGYSYVRLIVAALLEPFIYHPLIVLFSILGYFKFIMGKGIVWGEMKRKGFKQEEEETKPTS